MARVEQNGRMGWSGNGFSCACGMFHSTHPPNRTNNVSMQKDSKLFEDIARVASGVAGAAMDAKREVEAMVTDKLERLVSRGNFVTRTEFEVVRDMAQKAREENAALRAELEKMKR